MEVKNDYSLAQRTTFRVGGVASKFYIPESIYELQTLVLKLKDEEYRILSGGSNLLINDSKVFPNVICMENVDHNTENLGNGVFYIGASARIQRVIKFVNECGYGGIEEFIGLPALFGGMIYMNAGIGGSTNEKYNIGIFVKRVKCMDRITGSIFWLPKQDCGFSYRHSVFMNNQSIILGAEIELPVQEKRISEERIRDRRKYIKDHQEFGKGCFGSCFSECNGRILKMMSYFTRFLPGGVFQSRLNGNWLVNNGNGTYADAMRIIAISEKMHRIFHAKINTEVIIWK